MLAEQLPSPFTLDGIAERRQGMDFLNHSVEKLSREGSFEVEDRAVPGPAGAPSTASLRAAAGVSVHHSTLQDRLTHAESLLGWPVRTPHGRLRLQLALAMRQLARG